MFTGIIESVGTIVSVKKKNTNIELVIESNLSKELKVDQSLCHNGVCLTVEKIFDDSYQVTAIKETLDKSNLGDLQKGDKVNLERCLRMGDRLDGHVVQGHVDQIGKVDSITDEGGSFLIRISHEQVLGNLTVEKGSITVNGISLTAFDSTHTGFSIAVIPYTWGNTNLKSLKVNSKVNLEFDVLGKYVMKMSEIKK